uniref:Uncharacterized protein n=1 Tax=Anguilla anguilla TaxID=7936 RepID=A0A0E9XMJ5_ANGAN
MKPFYVHESYFFTTANFLCGGVRGRMYCTSQYNRQIGSKACSFNMLVTCYVLRTLRNHI